LLLISSVILIESKICDEGYKPHEQNGQTICIPNYLTGKILDPKETHIITINMVW
jgi:hypothetical protein